MLKTLSRALMLTLTLFALWWLLSGHNTFLLLSLGAASVVLVVIVQYRMHQFAQTKGHFAPRLWPMIKYLATLLVEIIRANIHIARVILSPFARIAPQVINVPARQKSEFGMVLFANSITLTPGTVSIETGDQNIIVHALTEKSADLDALAELEQHIIKLESRQT